MGWRESNVRWYVRRPCVSIFHRANKGLDGDSYLTHITSNYYALDAFVMFLQGSTESPYFVKLLLDNQDEWIPSAASDTHTQAKEPRLGFVGLGQYVCMHKFKDRT